MFLRCGDSDAYLSPTAYLKAGVSSMWPWLEFFLSCFSLTVCESVSSCLALSRFMELFCGAGNESRVTAVPVKRLYVVCPKINWMISPSTGAPDRCWRLRPDRQNTQIAALVCQNCVSSGELI